MESSTLYYPVGIYTVSEAYELALTSVPSDELICPKIQTCSGEACPILQRPLHSVMEVIQLGGIMTFLHLNTKYASRKTAWLPFPMRGVDLIAPHHKGEKRRTQRWQGCMWMFEQRLLLQALFPANVGYSICSKLQNLAQLLFSYKSVCQRKLLMQMNKVHKLLQSHIFVHQKLTNIVNTTNTKIYKRFSATLTLLHDSNGLQWMCISFVSMNKCMHQVGGVPGEHSYCRYTFASIAQFFLIFYEIKQSKLPTYNGWVKKRKNILIPIPESNVATAYYSVKS